MVKHLARINFDHCPLLLSLDSPPFKNGVRPIAFNPFGLAMKSSLVLLGRHGKVTTIVCAMPFMNLPIKLKFGIGKFLVTFFGKRRISLQEFSELRKP